MSNAPMHSDAARATMLTCELCRVQFPKKRGWQRFCKVECRNAWHAKMTPEALRKDVDRLEAQLADIKAANEALSQRVDELEAAVAKVPA